MGKNNARQKIMTSVEKGHTSNSGILNIPNAEAKKKKYETIVYGK